MKRLFVAFAAFALAAGIASAQDYNEAVKAYNLAAEADSKEEALAQFKSALAQFEACEEAEATEMVAKCKQYIAQTMISIAKQKINNSEFDEAIETLKETVATAEGFGLEEEAVEAKDLVPTAWSRKGAALLKAKDYAGAAAAYKAVTTLNPEDGEGQFRYGQALYYAKDFDEAIVALEAAIAAGKEAQAKPLLSNALVYKGQSLMKENKAPEAISYAEKANNLGENANAYNLIAKANTKLGKTKNSIEAYKKYLELKPDAPDAVDVIFTIAVTAQKANDKATAIEYYKKLAGTKYADQAKQQLGALQK